MSLLSAFNNNRINFFFVSIFSLFPVVLLLGSGAINIVIVIIDVFFLYKLYNFLNLDLLILEILTIHFINIELVFLKKMYGWPTDEL